jgi:hypothetical protein
MVWTGEVAELASNLNFFGHIQQANAELTQSLGLTFTKAFSVWCPLSTDVLEGDEIVGDGGTFVVKAIKNLSIGLNKHKQLFVEKKETYG